MNICQTCGKKTKNLKYCNSTCFAKTNNLGKNRHINNPRTLSICCVCGKETKNPKYCSLKCQASTRKLNIEDILCKNSLYTTGDAKNFILKNNLIVYECVECNNIGIWRGQKVALQLHHIDGDRTNHELKNLEFRCPNCHAITLNHSKMKKSKIDLDKLSILVAQGKNKREICHELKIPIDGNSFYKLKNALRRLA